MQIAAGGQRLLVMAAGNLRLEALGHLERRPGRDSAHRSAQTDRISLARQVVEAVLFQGVEMILADLERAAYRRQISSPRRMRAARRSRPTASARCVTIARNLAQDGCGDGSSAFVVLRIIGHCHLCNLVISLSGPACGPGNFPLNPCQKINHNPKGHPGTTRNSRGSQKRVCLFQSVPPRNALFEDDPTLRREGRQAGPQGMVGTAAEAVDKGGNLPQMQGTDHHLDRADLARAPSTGFAGPAPARPSRPAAVPPSRRTARARRYSPPHSARSAGSGSSEAGLRLSSRLATRGLVRSTAKARLSRSLEPMETKSAERISCGSMKASAGTSSIAPTSTWLGRPRCSRPRPLQLAVDQRARPRLNSSTSETIGSRMRSVRPTEWRSASHRTW